jgi:predicted nucleotidyltransferase
MGGMSFEESVLLEIMRAVSAAKLDAVVIGNAAAALHGVPVTTQDVDLFIRDTPRNAEKIDQLVRLLGKGATASRPFEPVSRMMRIEGLPVDIDLVFALSSHAKFESVKARSQVITIEGVSLRISDLQDVIDAKRAAGRPKDLATLPLLEEFVRVREAVERDSTAHSQQDE